MKYILIFLSITALLFAQEKVLTLEESLQEGLSNSKELKFYKSRIIQAEAGISEAGSKFYPLFTFGASYSRLSDVPPFTVTLPFSPNPVTLQEPVLNAFNFKLSFQQPLFTGFRLSAAKNGAEYNKISSELEFDYKTNEEALKIQRSFWTFYKSDKVVKLINKNLDLLKENLEDTKNFYDNGLVTKNDLLKIEVRLANMELMLIEAKNNHETARAMFNKSIGYPLERKTEISAGDIMPDDKYKNPEALIREALDNRGEIKSHDQRIMAGREQQRAAGADWYPMVNLFGNFYYSNPNQRIQPLTDEFNDTWDAGIALNWTIWDWGGRSAREEQAAEIVKQAETRLGSLKDGIELEVYGKYLQLKARKEKVDVSKKALASAEENYRTIKEKYDIQLATGTELLDAEKDWFNARIDVETSLADYEIARIELEKALGRKIY